MWRAGHLLAASFAALLHGLASRPAAFLLVLTPLARAQAAAAGGFPEPYASLYFTTDAVLSEFSHLAQRHGDVLQWTPPNEDVSPAAPYQVGVATFSVRGDGVSQAEVDGRPKLVLVFSEHAREIITSDLALWLARTLVGEAPDMLAWTQTASALAATRAALATASGALHVSPPAQNASISDWAHQLLQKVTIVMVPVPSARRAVEGGNTCLRKTLAGVDLNRNWPVAWRSGGSPVSEEYGGPGPLSEPQSRGLRDLVLGLPGPVVGYVQVHAGEWAMYVPWDHAKTEALGLPPDTHSLLGLMNAQCQCTRGSGGAASSYLAFGTSMDYMWQELGIPYSMTFEVYGANNEGKRPVGWSLDPAAPITPFLDTVAPSHPSGRRRGLLLTPEGQDAADLALAQQTPCLAMFNPATRGEYRTVIAAWVLNFLVLGDHLGSATPHVASRAPVREREPGIAGKGEMLGRGGGDLGSPVAGLAVLCILALGVYLLLRPRAGAAELLRRLREGVGRGRLSVDESHDRLV